MRRVHTDYAHHGMADAAAEFHAYRQDTRPTREEERWGAMPNLRAILIEDTAVQSELPDYRDMARAFHGEAGRGPGAHFIVTMAAALAEVHRSHKINPGDPCGTAAIRAELASLIDRWVAMNLPGRPGWQGPTRSVGSLADEMAAAQVAADHRRAGCASAGQDDVHAVHLQLGELATVWTDLIGEIAAAQPYPSEGQIEDEEDTTDDGLPRRIPGSHYPYAVTPLDPPPLELLIRVAGAVEKWEPGAGTISPTIRSSTCNDTEPQFTVRNP